MCLVCLLLLLLLLLQSMFTLFETGNNIPLYKLVELRKSRIFLTLSVRHLFILEKAPFSGLKLT